MIATLYFLIAIWLCALIADILIGLIELITGICLLVLGATLSSASALLNSIFRLWRIAIGNE